MPRYRRSYQRQLIALAIVVILAVARWRGWLPDAAPGGSASAKGAWAAGQYEVERVVDGDTLLLRNHERVRLQGIDCPEVAHEGHPDVDAWGPEATTFTQIFIRDAHSRVRLEADGEARDHYDRWLAFVYNGDRQLNEELVRAGLAHAKLNYEYSQQEKNRMRAAQLDAQRAGAGIWSPAKR